MVSLVAKDVALRHISLDVKLSSAISSILFLRPCPRFPGSLRGPFSRCILLLSLHHPCLCHHHMLVALFLPPLHSIPSLCMRLGVLCPPAHPRGGKVELLFMGRLDSSGTSLDRPCVGRKELQMDVGLEETMATREKERRKTSTHGREKRKRWPDGRGGKPG